MMISKESAYLEKAILHTRADPPSLHSGNSQPPRPSLWPARLLGIIPLCHLLHPAKMRVSDQLKGPFEGAALGFLDQQLSGRKPSPSPLPKSLSHEQLFHKLFPVPAAFSPAGSVQRRYCQSNRQQILRLFNKSASWCRDQQERL